MVDDTCSSCKIVFLLCFFPQNVQYLGVFINTSTVKTSKTDRWQAVANSQEACCVVDITLLVEPSQSYSKKLQEAHNRMKKSAWVL